MRYQRELCVVAREVSEEVAIDLKGTVVVLVVVVPMVEEGSWTRDCFDLAIMCWCVCVYIVARIVCCVSSTLCCF